MFLYLGDYAGFDEKEPTSKNGGKAEVIQMLKDKYAYSKLFMIGDGITDLEACPPADAFIGKFWNHGWCVQHLLCTLRFLLKVLIVLYSMTCFVLYLFVKIVHW